MGRSQHLKVGRKNTPRRKHLVQEPQHKRWASWGSGKRILVSLEWWSGIRDGLAGHIKVAPCYCWYNEEPLVGFKQGNGLI